MAAVDTRMPALYIGHGAPPLLDDALWSGQLAELSADLPRPTAILIVSAHWESAPISLSASGAPLVYDFGGFDPKYYEMTYRTPDASDLARKVAALMPATQPVHQHATRGLDHGAWVPLTIMYPAADVPVLQMSLPTEDPGTLLEIGRRLRPLRDEGVLIIGSGFLTHGLRYLREFRIDAPAPGWSTEFDHWASEAIARGDVDALANFRELAPGMPYAHPTVEHYTPLFVTLGASVDPSTPAEQIIDGFWMGLSKRSLLVA
ncbi:dioxygenase [Nocardioides lianchengensis]|uniref:4,5-DOPA dioxygenase extradiol n=1 Tax=Nocardioides lianchengensis TaxID=1045774 RepID=A0A1G7AP90_9ACTN|nr:class III extradiol ring-cleavage dioxygenase [Nocardioides lianchengensis]NYG13231.1 4,5-DOPA dioxygenase extradiol [Nocardioides lianchengensis]SDE16287.1 4,5-DOPA dioxygenase extradiol [Nocardioides lianchengensis]